MLLPEAGLDLLIEQLRAMPAADRRAVLARLSGEERRRARKRLAGRPAEFAEPVSPYSSDIAARIRIDGEAITAAGRKALDAFLAPPVSAVPRGDGRGASLAQAMGGLLRPLGGLR